MIYKCRKIEYKEIEYFDMVIWNGNNIKEVGKFVATAPLTYLNNTLTIIQPGVDQKQIHIGDYILKDKDRFFIYKQDEFRKIFEIV